MIGQTMFDWWHIPLENGGRNGEVTTELEAQPPGVSEMDWLESDQSLVLHVCNQVTVCKFIVKGLKVGLLPNLLISYTIYV